MTAVRTPDEARALFPGLSQVTYLDVAGRAPLATPVRDAINAFLDHAEVGGDKAAMFRSIEAARGAYAQLINASPQEIAITKNISEGLNIIANAIDWKPGDNVVVCEALEHANNVYVWRNLERRMGIQVRSLPASQGQYPIEAMAAAIDQHTRIVTACTHTFTPGLRTLIEPLGQAARKHGAMLVLDGAQTVGIGHLDLQQLPIDALATSTQKGLLGPYGMGFLYVRDHWADRLQPAYLARFGVDLGDAGEAAAGTGNYRLMDGARRFDLGNFNFLASAALEASLGLIAQLGTPAIEAHTRSLANQLAQGLHELGLPVFGGQHHRLRDHIVSVGVPGEGHNASGDPRMQSLYDALSSQGVKLSIRKDMLRFSFHLYNNSSDVDRVLDIAGRWATRGGKAAGLS
jgi:selenocysteine lyase/cysteine desulfurase